MHIIECTESMHIIKFTQLTIATKAHSCAFFKNNVVLPNFSGGWQGKQKFPKRFQSQSRFEPPFKFKTRRACASVRSCKIWVIVIVVMVPGRKEKSYFVGFAQ